MGWEMLAPDHLQHLVLLMMALPGFPVLFLLNFLGPNDEDFWKIELELESDRLVLIVLMPQRYLCLLFLSCFFCFVGDG